MNNIPENLEKIKAEIPKGVTLIAVSKTKPIEDIQTAFEAGQRHFGENKSQELKVKAPALSTDIRWHFIGHLQTKKVKEVVPYAHLIHSVDSEKLLLEINKRAEQNEKIQQVLLQIHIAQEEHKFGLDLMEAQHLLSLSSELSNVKVSGVMGMATFTDDQNQIKKEFETLKKMLDTLKTKDLDPEFKELSMGMSGDFKQAIKAGSTMVRIGSSIFGKRNYL